MLSMFLGLTNVKWDTDEENKVPILMAWQIKHTLTAPIWLDHRQISSGPFLKGWMRETHR